MPISETHLIDCMEYMAGLKDKSIDLAVVDPPYNVDMSGGKSPKNGFKGKRHWDKMNEWDNVRPDAKYFKELHRVSKNQVIWGANYYPEHLTPSMGWVFWYKMQDNFSFSDGEIAYTSFNQKTRIFKYARGNESGFAPKGEISPNIHPTQKPVALYKWIFQNYAKPGQSILDTHLGSQSSRIAAWDMGLDFYGCEIDPEYFEQGNARFEAHKSRPPLFPPDQMYNFEQTKLF